MATDDEGTTCNGLLRLLHRYTQHLPHRFPISGSSKNHPHIISLGLRIKEITIAHLQHILCPAGKDQPACVSVLLFGRVSATLRRHLPRQERVYFGRFLQIARQHHIPVPYQAKDKRERSQNHHPRAYQEEQ